MEFRYPSVGRCIYCGSTPSTLGDEHIIPFSLNGALVLPDASCKDCEKITHRYERTVARMVFGNFRMKHNVQSRRVKRRPSHIEIGTLSPNGTRGKALVPVAEHPTMLFVYKFDQPTMLRSLPPEVEDFRWVPISIFGKAELDAFIEKYHWDRTTSIKTVPVEFARTLAKIAYSYTVAEIGLDSFRPLPQTLDVILGRTTNVSYPVGGDWEIPAPDPAGKHKLDMICTVEGTPKVTGARIVVEIRLFPAFETPQYRVVVGHFDFQNPQHFKRFDEKARESQFAG